MKCAEKGESIVAEAASFFSQQRSSFSDFLDCGKDFFVCGLGVVPESPPRACSYSSCNSVSCVATGSKSLSAFTFQLSDIRIQLEWVLTSAPE